MFYEEDLITLVKICLVIVIPLVVFVVVCIYLCYKRNPGCRGTSSFNSAMFYNNMNHMNMISAQAHQNYLNEQAEQRNRMLMSNANTNAQLLLDQQYRTQDLMQKTMLDNKLDRFERNFNSFFDGFNSIMS